GGQRTSDDTGGEGRTIWCGCLSVEFYQQVVLLGSKHLSPILTPLSSF
ncbi:unnamed protein product, partial [Choristocarpus tenellus]